MDTLLNPSRAPCTVETMKKLSAIPRNKEFFEDLISYGAAILKLCRINGIDPITYGSLAYLAHSGDGEIEISDIDLLVPELDFEKIISIFSGLEGITVETTTYHSLKLLKGRLKVSFDAIDHYLVGLSASSQEVSFNGATFKVIGFDALTEVYDRGAKSIPPKREAYETKLRNLRALASR